MTTYGNDIGEGRVYAGPQHLREFSDAPEDGECLVEVRAYSDCCGLQGIQCVWVNASGALREGAFHGNAVGKMQVLTLDVNDEECIESHSVRRGVWTDALLLKTSSGRQFAVGNTSGGGLVVTPAPLGGMVVGFWGRAGGCGAGIRAIGPRVVNRPDDFPRPRIQAAPKKPSRATLRFDWKAFDGAGFGGWGGFNGV